MKSFLTSKLDVIGWFFFMKLKKKAEFGFGCLTDNFLEPTLKCLIFSKTPLLVG